MNMKIVILLFVFLIFHSTSASKSTDSYAVYVPKNLRAGSGFTVSASILQNENPVLVTASLKYGKSAVITASATIAQGETKLISTAEGEIIPHNYDGTEGQNMTITGVDTITNKQVFVNHTRGFYYKKKSLSILIQTDKGIYQPGHTIKFRVIVVDSDLKPIDTTVTYTIRDPNRNTILMRTNIPLTKGVASDELQLISDPVFGDWEIEAKAKNMEESVTVKVDEYNLPKFKVEVETPNFMTKFDDDILVTVNGIYTYGQKVRGSAKIVISHENRYWYRYTPNPTNDQVLTVQSFNGTYSFNLTLAEVVALGWTKEYQDSIQINASITDKTSQDTFHTAVTVDLVTNGYKLEKKMTPETIKPGLKYIAYIQLVKHDGSLLSMKEIETTTPTITITVDGEDAETQTLTMGNTGDMKVEYMAPTTDFNSIRFNFKSDQSSKEQSYTDSWYSERFETKSNKFIQIISEESTLKIDKVATIMIKATEPLTSYTVLVIAKGVAMLHDTVNSAEATNEASYQFTTLSTMSPSVTIVVTQHLGDDNEIISDSITLNIEPELSNKVSISVSDDNVDAGTVVDITVSAEADSYISLLGVDQSVALLKEGNDMTTKRIFEEQAKFSSTSPYDDFGPYVFFCWWPWYNSGSDTGDIFENAGLIVLSDSTIYNKQQIYFDIFGESAESDYVFVMEDYSVAMPQADDSENGAQVKVERSYFPETWMWHNKISADGNVFLQIPVPDTITSWDITSWAVNTQDGLGVANKNKITVFRQFFVEISMLPSMVNKEQLVIRVTVYNYFDVAVNAKLTLTPSEHIQIDGEDISVFEIPAKDSVTTSISISAIKAGTGEILAKAQTHESASVAAMDSMKGTIRIRPEGKPISTVQNFLIQKKADSADFAETLSINFPSNAVPDSSTARIAFYGDLMGSSLENIDKLIKVPTGCGEQNMLGFAPDVYIAMYLKNSGKMTTTLDKLLTKHMINGYQKELTYRRDDYSFSAFGESDNKGSTWLTAFVIRCFLAANTFNSDLIALNEQRASINFLLNMQNKDNSKGMKGVFVEEGRVIHSGMQGGSHGQDTMTAYVVIALTEYLPENFFDIHGDDSFKTKYDESIEDAVEYLEAKLPELYQNENPLSLSIVAYALILAKSGKAEEVLDKLESLATVDGEIKYWRTAEEGTGVSTGDIETAAYMLLSYAKRPDLYSVDDSMFVVRWLLKQMNANGGFQSTQDTVVGIQALSKIASLQADTLQNLEITITNQEAIQSTIQINKENNIVLQTIQLPSLSGEVSVTAAGEGMAAMQLYFTYNLAETPQVESRFKLMVDVNDEDTKKIQVRTCTSLNDQFTSIETNAETGMVLLSIPTLTGYSYDLTNAQKDNPNAKRVERVDSKLNFYIDELIEGKEECFTASMTRMEDVGKVSPQMATVFNYYHPEQMQEAAVYSRILQNSTTCARCPDCFGCSAAIGVHRSTNLYIVITSTVVLLAHFIVA